MKTELEIKQEMCEIGRRVYNRGMVAANDGNFSVKLNEHEFLCTPTGVSKGFMTPEFICKENKKGGYALRALDSSVQRGGALSDGLSALSACLWKPCKFGDTRGHAEI